MEFARKLPFLAGVAALLTLSVGSLVISQGVVGAQTDSGVETDAPVDNNDNNQGVIDQTPALPPAAPVDTNPLNAGTAGTGNSNANANANAGVDAAGLPATGNGGYLDSSGSSTSTLYMIISVVAMVGLSGSLIYARSRSK
ncbi:MAG TPA: hypothetical protein VFX19_07765 [Dehalococcoidia bacterium]|nr:hypothetical protein [Dehalococcoidia bacterium]